MISRDSLTGAYPTKPLGEVVHFLDSRRRPVTESDRRAGPYPYYGANGQQGTIDEFIFDEPLVLLAEDGGHFETPDRGIAYRVEGKTWVNNHAHVLRPKTGVDVGFLCRVLENYDVTPYVTGTTRGKLTQAGASEILVPVPSLPEQQRIADVLDRAEALRARRRSALAQLDTLTQSMFFDLFGDPFASSDGTLLLGDIAQIDMGQSPPGSSYNTTGLGIPLLNGPTEFGRRYPTQAQWTTSPTRLCLAGDILFCVRGATAGRLNRADKIYCLGRGLAAIRPRGGGSANADFLFAVLDRYYPYFQQRGVGSTFINISREDIETLPIPRPQPDRVEALARYVAAVEGLRATQRASLAKLDALFASLQYRAIRGEL